MKIDDVWYDTWMRLKYLSQDVGNFLFESLVMIIGYSIIIVWNTKEFMERRMKK